MRVVTGATMPLKELARKPTTAALLVALPPVAVEVYGVALESFPALPGLGGDPATVGRMTGTLFAVAFLAGLVGLFEVISARRGDRRLALCGFPRHSLLAARLLSLVVVAGVAATVAFAVLAASVDVAAPALAAGVLVLTGLLYGLVGVLVGTLLPREVEGSLVLVFLADIDNVLASGLFDVGPVAAFAPLYHPHALFEAAVLEGTLAADHLLWTLALVGGLVAAAFLAYLTVAAAGGVRG